jgi:branched-chain amino acid transport system ATP-binding protein
MAGLAPVIVDEIYERLHLPVSDGLGILVVDQSVDRAMAHADPYYALNGGCTVLDGVCSAARLEAIEETVLGTSSLGTR